MASFGGGRRRPDPVSRLDGSPFLQELAGRTEEPGEAPPVPTRASLAERNDAAVEQWSAGRAVVAVEALADLAAACEAVLGPEDPDTLVVQGNLAVLHAELEQWHLALPLLAANTAARERVLGDEHESTLAAREALAAAHRLGGDPSQAVLLSARVTAQRTRVLGPGHRQTLVSRTGHALARAGAGDTVGAAEHLAGALHQAERVLGANDPLAGTLREHLALLRAEDDAPSLPPPASPPVGMPVTDQPLPTPHQQAARP